MIKAKELKKLRKEAQKIAICEEGFFTDLDDIAAEHMKLFWHLISYLISLLMIVLITGMWCNIHGYREVNYYIAIVMFIVSVALFTRPELLIFLLKMDIINMLVPQKYQLDLKDAIFITFLRIAKRLIAFCISTFLFLGFLSIKDSVELFVLLLMGSIVVILVYTK